MRFEGATRKNRSSSRALVRTNVKRNNIGRTNAPRSSSYVIPFTPSLMKEYQVVVAKLSRHTHEDEDTLTDLLNERSRGGWRPALVTQGENRMTFVFERDTTTES